MASPRHLLTRFVGSLWPGGPAATDDAWATRHLLVGEVDLWRRMRGFDRRHAVGVARRVAAHLGPDATRPVMAAALLHDVGKLDSDFGVWRRVGATLLTAARGHERVVAGSGRTARYVQHPAIGADMLRAAGSDPLTIAWAAEHHLPPNRWSLESALADALKLADDD